MFDFSPLLKSHESDRSIAWRMQYQSLKVGLEVIGESEHTLTIGPHDITLSNSLEEQIDFKLSAESNSWSEYCRTAPRPNWQSLASMIETSLLEVKANHKGILQFMRHSFMLEALFSKLRPPKPVTAKPWGNPSIEPISGRYLRVDIDGKPHRIYFEESGEGIPLLCLHTAGSDGRQYRALMNDPQVTQSHRVIAFDLPWHGKSAPPPGFHLERNVLTTDGYVDVIMAVKNALNLQQPIVMGCSIGGRAVLHLALRHGDEFKAAIGLQSATHAESKMQEKLGIMEENVLFRPDMDGGDVGAAAVRQLMSPVSPAEDEWETLYYYMQSAPGVFHGDLYYYMLDGDMRNGIAGGIDTEQCPVYLLTGDYDLSATPEKTRELAEEIGATHFEVMEGLGHFPMSEDPEKFRSYLLPVLEKIKNQD